MDGLLRRTLTISDATSLNVFYDSVSKRQILAKDEVLTDVKDKDAKESKGFTYVVVICTKQPHFLSPFNTLSKDVKIIDDLKNAILTYGYMDLVQHFSNNHQLEVVINPDAKNDKHAQKFAICIDEHIELN